VYEALDEVEAESTLPLEEAAGGHDLQLGGLTTHIGAFRLAHDLDQAIEAHGPFATDAEHEEDVHGAEDTLHLSFREWGDTVLN
jgi:hypothetical protein